MELDGYGEISATNAVESIQASKAIPFYRVLFGLNIPDVGWVTAQNLARHFENVDRLLDATQEDIQEVDGIGPDRAEAIAEWFADEQNRALVAELRDARAPLRDRRRGEAGRGAADRQHVRDHGHARGVHARARRPPRSRRSARRSTNSVSKKTTGVIVGEEPGNSKLTKAQQGGRAAPRPSARRSKTAPASRALATDARSGPARGAPTSRDRTAVLEDREGVAVAHVAGRAPTRRPSCPSSRARARGAGAEPVAQRAVDAGDRQRREERGSRSAGSVHATLQQRDERRRGQAVEPREAGAVDDAHAAERHAARRAAPPSPSRRRARSCRARARARPSCFSSISAVKLSLSTSMKRTIAPSGGECTTRAGSPAAGVVPTRGRAGDGDAGRPRARRGRAARPRARASRDVRRAYRARSTTSAESGGDSSM